MLNVYQHNLMSEDKLKQFGAENEFISSFLVRIKPFPSYHPDHMVSVLCNNLQTCLNI